MKAFIAFVVLLFIVIGAGGGYWAWGKFNKVEEWGLSLDLGEELQESETEIIEERYNAILDQEVILKKTVEKHDLKSYYGVSNAEEAIAKLKEDTFVRIRDRRAIHVLFRGQRKTRDERETAVRTLSEDFLKQVQAMSGR